ncbi:unnamed protein product, partial [Brachionus calyciflorus]
MRKKHIYFYLLILLSIISSPILFLFRNETNIPSAVLSRNKNVKTNFDQIISEFHKINKNECDPRPNNITYTKCLNALKNLHINFTKLKRKKCSKCLYIDNQKQIVYHHTFWQMETQDKNYLHIQIRMLKLNLMSYLSTQNLCCTKFILWKLSTFSKLIEQKISSQFSKWMKNSQLEIKTFNLEKLCILSLSTPRSNIYSYDLCKDKLKLRTD